MTRPCRTGKSEKAGQSGLVQRVSGLPFLHPDMQSPYLLLAAVGARRAPAAAKAGQGPVPVQEMIGFAPVLQHRLNCVLRVDRIKHLLRPIFTGGPDPQVVPEAPVVAKVRDCRRVLLSRYPGIGDELAEHAVGFLDLAPTVQECAYKNISGYGV